MGDEQLDMDTRFLPGPLEKLRLGRFPLLEGLADEDQLYDIVSSCAHKFPMMLLEKLRAAYENAKSQTEDTMKAIDAVREFMGENPGWAEKPPRNGNITISTKRPTNPEAYEKATDDVEKRKAYCFCPLVRNSLDKGMPITFCNCAAGWFRQQWEYILKKPVKIDIVKSILKGDDVCQFAIHLPVDAK